MSAAQRAGASAAPVLLLSGYELGHQPLGVAAPLAWLAAAGIAAQAVDLAQEPLAHAAPALRKRCAMRAGWASPRPCIPHCAWACRLRGIRGVFFSLKDIAAS